MGGRKIQPPSQNEPIANDWRYDDFSTIEKSHVEDLAAVEQPPSEDNEGSIPLVSNDEIDKEASEGISPHPTVKISSQETNRDIKCPSK